MEVKATLKTDDGAFVTAANPLPVTGVVTASDLDLRNLSATTDTVKVEPGVADIKVTLDGEAVTVGNTSFPVVAFPSASAAIEVASGASLSGEIDLGGNTLVAISMPDAFTGTTLTFQASRTSGGTFKSVYDDYGYEVAVTVATARMVAIAGAALKLAPFRYLKIRSGTAASATTETATRTLYLVTK